MEAAEARIDETLRSRYQGTGPVAIGGPLEGLNERSRREVLRRYICAGWNVEEKTEAYDFRDQCGGGRYWSFSASAGDKEA